MTIGPAPRIMIFLRSVRRLAFGLSNFMNAGPSSLEDGAEGFGEAITAFTPAGPVRCARRQCPVGASDARATPEKHEARAESIARRVAARSRVAGPARESVRIMASTAGVLHDAILRQPH